MVKTLEPGFEAFRDTTDWLRLRAARTPNACALHIGDESWTFGELDVLVDRFGHALARHNINRGTHCALLLPNSLGYVVALLALARLGAVAVPLNSRLTASEVAWQLTKSGATSLVHGSSFKDLARRAAPDSVTLSLPEDTAGLVLWLSSVESPRRAEASNHGVDSLQGIIFTSGTSGRPKGAMLTFANHYWSAIASADRIGVRDDDIWLSVLPLYHVGGQAILFRSVVYGTAMEVHSGFDTHTVLDSLRYRRASLLSLVPTMLDRLLRAGLTRRDAPTLRLILLGGAAAPASLLDAATDAGLPVATTYGLTEAASQVATAMPEQLTTKPGSVGRPLARTRITICGEDGQPHPNGTIGEIVVTGPTVMRGYYDDVPATAAALRTDGFHTGDLGYLDDDGDLWVVARRSDLILSGGENVYPAEVEGVLCLHDAVAQVCVVGIADNEWGARVAAAVQVRPGMGLTADDLDAFARQHLAGYKVPRLIAFVKEMPLTGSGKIDRAGVVALLEEVRECG